MPIALSKRPDLAIQRISLVSSQASNLHQAYLETHYIVQAQAAFVLQIGYFSHPLQALYREHKTTCCAYLTADNPYSQACSPADNALAQAALEAELTEKQWIFYTGAGQHPTNNWPAEASFLILGISLDEARVLARRYRQTAFLWADEQTTPQLFYSEA